MGHKQLKIRKINRSVVITIVLVLVSITLVGPVLYPRNQGPAGATING